MLSLISMSVGCSQVENIAMGLENDIENTTETTSESITTTTTEVTTSQAHYDPTLTVSMYEPSATSDIYETETSSTQEFSQESVSTDYTEDDGKYYSTYSTTLDPTYTTTVKSDTTTEDTYTSTDTQSLETTQQEYTSTENSSTSEVVSSSTTIDSSYLFNDCAFIGDSLTVGLSMYDYIPQDYTFAQEGISLLKINSLQLSTTCGYVYPAQAVAGWQSKHVYILLGINGVTWISNDTAIARYTQLINDILTYSTTVEDINVISVLPVAYSMETKSSVESGRILNSEVDAFNERLQTMANELGVNYIDVNSKLKNTYGRLPDNLTVDGLHLTQLGYEIVRNALVESVQ
jgi:hypothetical protein